MKKSVSSVVLFISSLFVASIAQAEFLVGIEVSSNQMQPEFNQLITFEPEPTSQRFHLVTQKRESRSGAFKLSLAVREEYLNGFVSLGLAINF